MSVNDNVYGRVFSVAAMATYTIRGRGLRTGPVLQIILHQLCGVSNWTFNEGQQ